MLCTGREVRMGKNCARGLEYGPRLKAECSTQDQRHSFSHTDRPSPVNNIVYFSPAVHWFYRVLMGNFVYATLVIESACAPSTNDLKKLVATSE